jgi:hypothetical protein
MKFLSVRLTPLFRGIAAVLAVVLVGNSVAFAAGKALDPVKLKQKLTARGIGNSVKPGSCWLVVTRRTSP